MFAVGRDGEVSVRLKLVNRRVRNDSMDTAARLYRTPHAHPYLSVCTASTSPHHGILSVTDVMRFAGAQLQSGWDHRQANLVSMEVTIHDTYSNIVQRLHYTK
ncbi:hypothetical protein J6590_007772 [Homalodisca vitripennis]|nr:hypothetical protein J6590_007772 [Homalodisca vitripennis]